jgi:hypothetical protein
MVGPPQDCLPVGTTLDQILNVVHIRIGSCAGEDQAVFQRERRGHGDDLNDAPASAAEQVRTMRTQRNGGSTVGMLAYRELLSRPT